jgi:hypothetical protein
MLKRYLECDAARLHLTISSACTIINLISARALMLQDRGLLDELGKYRVFIWFDPSTARLNVGKFSTDMKYIA